MKANVPKTPTFEQALMEMQKNMDASLKMAATNGVLLGAQAIAKSAMEMYGNDYLYAKTQKDKIQIANELVDYLNKSQAKGDKMEDNQDA